MLHFVVGLYQSLVSVPEYRILIIGHENSGKSVLMEQLKYMYHPNNTSTGEVATVALPSLSTSSSKALVTANSQSRTQSSGPAGDETEGDALDALRSVLKSSMEKAELSHAHASAHGNGASTGTKDPAKAGAAHPHDSDDGREEERGRQRQPLPAGTPLPAPPSYLAAKRIRPTVGMNYAKITHHYCPSPSFGGASLSAPPPGQRSLVMWDVGGEASLRTLWANYFPQCQAILYVVDSSLYHEAQQQSRGGGGGGGSNGLRGADKATRRGGEVAGPMTAERGEASPSPDSMPAPTSSTDAASSSHKTGVDVAAAKAVYTGNRQTLESLLLHPQLQGVPILIFSNKTDLPSHLALADMQDALDVADLAVKASFYKEAAANPEGTRGGGTGSGAKEGDPALLGTCGFGRVVMRLAEGSALDGRGVAVALDWLVAQLERGAREVEHDSGK